jgi:hypothetical protein
LKQLNQAHAPSVRLVSHLANMNNGSKTAHEKRARRAPAEKNR